MSEFERAAAAVRAEAARWHLPQQAARFLAAAGVAFGTSVASAGIHDWTWSALGGLAAGALVTAFRQLWPSVPVESVISRLAADVGPTQHAEPPTTTPAPPQ